MHRGWSPAGLRPAERNEHAGEGMRDNGISPIVEPHLIGSVEPGNEHVPGVQVVVIQARRSRSLGQAIAPRPVGLAPGGHLPKDLVLAGVTSVCDGAPHHLHRLVEAPRHDLRSHVGNADGQSGIGLAGEVALQLRVALHDRGERRGERCSGEAICECRAAVREQNPAASSIDGQRDERALRRNTSQELVKIRLEGCRRPHRFEPDGPVRCRGGENSRPRA